MYELRDLIVMEQGALETSASNMGDKLTLNATQQEHYDVKSKL